MGQHTLPSSRDDFLLWDRIGDVCWREALRDEARRAWERARALEPGDARIRRKLAVLDHGGDPLLRSA